jgi:putative hemolysin
MPHTPRFETRLARSAAEIRAAQRLRYDVFVAELGGDGNMVDHDARLECDPFDAHADHLLLLDHAREGAPVVGVYRLLMAEQAVAAGAWYTAEEYDLTPLLSSGRKLLELGRSCLDISYRGGPAMMHLWQALADVVLSRDVDILFGVASFHGTDPDELAGPLSLLHHRHLAPEAMRPRARPPHAIEMNRMPEGQIDRPSALRATPALIKAYLRLGGCVGSGAWVDHQFNTTDVCLVMDTASLSEKHRARYVREGRP